MKNLTVSAVAAVLIMIGGTLAAIKNIGGWIPFAYADQVEQDIKRIEDKADTALKLDAKLDLMDVKADIRAIERTPKEERSDFENSELEELKAKKESLTREITK